MSESIRVERRGAVLQVEINRPEKKNALTLEMYEALADAVSKADGARELRVILITAAGDAFTAGSDLRDFLDRPPTDEDSPVYRFLQAMVGARLPIVAAVQGLAVGIGTTMLLHCDLVYASCSARFHVPFTSLGLVPEAGSSLLLPQRIGYARAAEMLLLGEAISADDALAAGLISGVFEDDLLHQKAWSRAERLASLPPESVQITKSLMRDAFRTRLPDQMRRESERFAERLRSNEARSVMRQFFDGRSR